MTTLIDELALRAAGAVRPSGRGPLRRYPSSGLGSDWVPACGGTETPFHSRSGRTLLYCWQPSTGRHAYLDCGTDLILSDEEARACLATS